MNSNSDTFFWPDASLVDDEQGVVEHLVAVFHHLTFGEAARADQGDPAIGGLECEASDIVLAVGSSVMLE
ncbi:hypothetical protein [Vogesella sp. LIG4]|uniref:hypothetical protein n=1 Tax=Vogesella sp. LIG4 TaxID=1192162 RepID=UPI0012FD5F3D|nr:hypothetical protein [Vogesella sp. LIG4]